MDCIFFSESVLKRHEDKRNTHAIKISIVLVSFISNSLSMLAPNGLTLPALSRGPGEAVQPEMGQVVACCSFVGTLYGTGVTVPIIFGVGMAISTSVISLSGRDINLNILLGSHLSYHNSFLQNSMINFVDRFLISRKYT